MDLTLCPRTCIGLDVGRVIDLGLDLEVRLSNSMPTLLVTAARRDFIPPSCSFSSKMNHRKHSTHTARRLCCECKHTHTHINTQYHSAQNYLTKALYITTWRLVWVSYLNLIATFWNCWMSVCASQLRVLLTWKTWRIWTSSARLRCGRHSGCLARTPAPEDPGMTWEVCLGIQYVYMFSVHSYTRCFSSLPVLSFIMHMTHWSSDHLSLRLSLSLFLLFCTNSLHKHPCLAV